MWMKSFDAQVVNGQLQFQEPLTALEGEQVRITLTPIPVTVPPLQPPATALEDDAEPPDWLNVEKDIYVPMFSKGKTLTGVRVVPGEPIHPCIILPEALPDDA